MRGYFGIGMEGVTKAMNAGALFRTANAFGASFMFTIAAQYPRRQGHRTDTSGADVQIPFYAFPDLAALLLPDGCALVGVEITDDAIDLPSFHHPRCAAYVFGPERGALSAGVIDRCAHVVRIPTRFSINVGLAGAIVMYDRVLSRGRFARRPQWPGGPAEPPPPPAWGDPILRRKAADFREDPPTP